MGFLCNDSSYLELSLLTVQPGQPLSPDLACHSRHWPRPDCRRGDDVEVASTKVQNMRSYNFSMPAHWISYSFPHIVRNHTYFVFMVSEPLVQLSE